MNRFERIMTMMMRHYNPVHLALKDNSSEHAGHYGPAVFSETHYQLVVESYYFQGMSPVQIHQHIYRLLEEELNSGLHAIAISASVPKTIDD